MVSVPTYTFREDGQSVANASEFRADLRDRLPLPLARLYTRSFNAKSRLERHHVAVSLLEATARLVASAQIAVHAASGRRDTGLEARLENLALPSLGHWVEFLREASRATAGYEPHPFPDLAGVFRSLVEERDDLPATRAALVEMGKRVEGVPEFGKTKVRALDLFDRLPAYRNQVGAHAAIRKDDAFYAEMAGLLVAAAEEVLDRLALLGKAVLVYVSEVRETPSGRVIDLWNLTGSEALVDTAPPDAHGAAGSHLEPGRLYLQRGDLFLDLHPLLVCDPAPPEAGVAFLNRSQVERRRVEYLDFVVGAVAAAPHLLDDQRRFLSRLLGREVSPVDLSALQDKSASESPEPSAEQAAPASRIFGDFELLGQLGEGGMGVVYLARQRSLGRVVALKMLPPSAGSNDVSVARFQREIRALARADHPNVVRILSSGRTEGTWWYAMEHVDGCDLREAGRSLPESESRSSLSGGDLARAVSSASDHRRAEIPAAFANVPQAPRPPTPDLGAGRSFFVRVAEIGRDAAQGLHHLHERGIVHRDVKPGNLMVTRDDGRAVVMDLGLARLTGDASVTQAAAVLGSIPYAAPEQIQEALIRRKIDARADVYGLGATLYDLLTGRAPYRGEDGPSLVAQVLRDAPAPPRRLDRSIPRDLEAVVMKAMERDPERRYPSAAALADDLDRFSRGDPVTARPPSVARLARQWVRRHAVLSSAIAVALVSGAISTVLYVRGISEKQRQTERARARAASERDRAENLAYFMLFDLRDGLLRSGRYDLLETTSSRVLSQYETVSEDVLTPAALRRKRVAIENLGIVHLRRGEVPEALAAFRQAQRIDELLSSLHPDDLRTQDDAATTRWHIGEVLRAQGDVERSLAEIGKALAITITLARRAPKDVDVRRHQAWDHSSMAGILGDEKGDWSGAADHEEAAAALFATSVAETPKDEARLELAMAHRRAGRALHRSGRSAEAEKHWTEAIEILRGMQRDGATDFAVRYEWGVLHSWWGEDLHRRGDARAAIEKLRVAVSELGALLAQAPDDADLQLNLAFAWHQLALAQRAVGETDNALASFRASVGISEARLAKNAAGVNVRDAAAGAHRRIGQLLEDRRDVEAALREYRTAAAETEALLVRNGANERWRGDLEWALGRVARLLEVQGDWGGAAETRRRQVESGERTVRVSPSASQAEADLAAERRALRGDELLAGPARPETGADRAVMASALYRGGRYAESAAAFAEALQDASVRPDLDAWVVYDAACAAALASAGAQGDVAGRWRATALEWLAEDVRRRRVLLTDIERDLRAGPTADRKTELEKGRERTLAHFRHARAEDPDMAPLRGLPEFEALFREIPGLEK